MGKGDIKTKRGKIANQSYGKTRPHKTALKAQQEVKKDTSSKK